MTGVGHPQLRLDAPALYEAVQRARDSRGCSWSDVERAVGVPSSTVRRLRRAADHADHDAELALRLAAWTAEPLESYVVGCSWPGELVAHDPRGIVVRGSQVRELLDARRRADGLTWRQLAAELTIGWSTLERLGPPQEGRPRVRLLLLACKWLELPTASFVERREVVPRGTSGKVRPPGRGQRSASTSSTSARTRRSMSSTIGRTSSRERPAGSVSSQSRYRLPG
jgi:transcriptional regulator with XRE-family HTH domain